MNRHNPPTIGELTLDELTAMVVADGAITLRDAAKMSEHFHNVNLYRGAVSFAGRVGLTRRTLTGDLTLCTRRTWPCPAHPQRERGRRG